MTDLKSKGIGMIYISHRMDEINRISDRITVMRDGEYVGTLITKDTTKDEIVKMMVGRVIYGDKKEESNVKEDTETVLEVKKLCRGNEIKNVSFKLRKGEILGFSGLMGSGRTEVARAIYGADEFDSGEIFINGKKVDIKTPNEAVKNGVCYLSEDRKRYGLLLDKSIAENSVLSSLDDYIKMGWIDDSKIEKDAVRENAKLKTKTPSIRQLTRNLSGGNQQKVIFGRWLLTKPKILLLDEPTRGIDVGAKYEIYQIITDLAKQGRAVIMVSGEMPELLGICDRIMVLSGGRVAGFAERDATQEQIMTLAAKYV